ncbi:MAG: hypothetical protein LBQ47_07415, partial [Endomicrobium sp.]|nr:hypothetical protein [Endomicrobium sp.]
MNISDCHCFNPLKSASGVIIQSGENVLNVRGNDISVSISADENTINYNINKFQVAGYAYPYGAHLANSYGTYALWSGSPTNVGIWGINSFRIFKLGISSKFLRGTFTSGETLARDLIPVPAGDTPFQSAKKRVWGDY